MAANIADGDLEVPSIFLGTFAGLFFLTITKVAQQSWRIWGRTHSLANLYLWMIWTEAIVNVIFALTTYLFIRGDIPGSLAYYFGAVTLWMLQTQLLLQIIANRVGLIMIDRKKARLIKIVLLVVIGLVNISVYCIWIPAHMNVGDHWVKLNHIWERVEKSIFLVVDLGLNAYFLYLVRSQLIARGMTKYWRLYHFNAGIVVLSVLMDLLLLGLLSLPNPYHYVQFAPVAYIVKLHIELTMAILISKIVRGHQRVDNHRDESTDRRHTTHISHHEAIDVPSALHLNSYVPGTNEQRSDTKVGNRDTSSSIAESDRYDGEGIKKTVIMTVSDHWKD